MIYPQMRRNDRELPPDEGYQIIHNAEYGVLSLSFGDYPYCVALSHAIKGDTIYFHCAKQGFKVNIIERNPNGYFLFVENAHTLKKEGSVKYRSSGAIGTLRNVMDDQEKHMALKLITDRYMGQEYEAEACDMIKKSAGVTAIYAFDIIRITGKYND